MNAAESSPFFQVFADSDPETPPIHFETRYRGNMQMYAPSATVAEYLNRHEGWFHRCAKPMKVEPFTEQGYILTVGRFGSFGYEVEPKIAVVFDPPENNAYRMYNVPVPDDPIQGYAVDYNALMNLGDLPWEQLGAEREKMRKRFGDRPMPEIITQVTWQLHLQVMVQFPKFIYKLPQKLLKSSGDRLLATIVAQISPHLTAKIQHDFHHRLNLPIPPKSGSCFEQILTLSLEAADETTEEDIAASLAELPEELVLELPTDDQ